jgi:hypothetical protein
VILTLNNLFALALACIMFHAVKVAQKIAQSKAGMVIASQKHCKH